MSNDEADKNRIWTIAGVSGGVVYAILLVLHLSAGGSGSVAYRVGEMVPIAAVSTVVVAWGARAVQPRTSPWWLIALGVFGVAGVWYAAVEVVPRAVNDARIEASGQADYTLSAPMRAGDWTRLDGAGATKREEDALARFDRAPDDLRSSASNVVYAEYAQRKQAGLVFFGLEVTGELEGEARESSDDTLRNFMAGSGAPDAESMDAGELGGSLACMDDAPGLPADVVYCAWADAATVGQVTIAQVGLDTDEAADLTREFRSLVTVR
ncbi:MAG: hypothetical protein ACRDO4_12975 [Nocardioides sp.]